MGEHVEANFFIRDEIIKSPVNVTVMVAVTAEVFGVCFFFEL